MLLVTVISIIVAALRLAGGVALAVVDPIGWAVGTTERSFAVF